MTERIGILIFGVLLGMGLVGQGVSADDRTSLTPAETDLDIQSDYETDASSQMHRSTSKVDAKTKPTLAPQQEKLVLDFVNQYMKAHAAHLAEMKPRNPADYQRTVALYYPRIRQLLAMPAAMRDAHVQNANLRLQIFRTVKSYHASKSDAERTKLKAHLKTLLSDKFDVEQKVREYRLHKLGEQLNRLKQEMKHRADDRNKVIAKQMNHWLKLSPQASSRPTTDAPTSAPTTAPSTQPAK